MMRTPSIDRRITIAGLAVLAVLLVALDGLLFFSLRSSISRSANAEFAAQAAAVQTAAAFVGPDALAERLGAIGIKAEVITPDGKTLRSDPAVTVTEPGLRQASREVAVGDGMRVFVSSPNPAGDPRLGRLLVLEAVATPLLLVLAVLLLRWIAEVALKPLDLIATRARLTTLGHRGERLQPDRPATRLGQMATAYDDMLDALEGAVDEATAARAESDRSEARTRRFLDDAAHQLRSPITSIRACAETLSRNVTPDQHDRLLRAVVRDSERASRLMAGLLRMARLNQEQAIEREPTDVLALCNEIADRATVESQHLEITARAAGQAVPLADLAPMLVTEILSNLVDNARRHARSRIDITAHASGRSLEVRVTDDGPGLPEDQIELAFERFVSLDEHGGSGLGLPIARELAQAQGGNLAYEDGAFVLRLPCALRAVQAGEPLSAGAAP